jgi:hypothetical protein
MSAANMGISQLEALQLRRLVGPSGIGNINLQSVGNLNGQVTVLSLTLIPAVGNNAYGLYVNPAITVPSGSGIMQVHVNVGTEGGVPLYIRVQPVTDQLVTLGPECPSSIGFPTAIVTQNFPGWTYQGTVLYNNPSPDPAPVLLTVGCQGTTTVCNLVYFAVNCISFGPHVNQG